MWVHNPSAVWVEAGGFIGLTGQLMLTYMD